MHIYERKQTSAKKGITRRNFLIGTLGSVAATPLFFQTARETLSAPSISTNRDHAVRLSLNENPFGPSPRAIRAILKNSNRSHRYVYSTIEDLYSALMQHNSIEKDMIIPGTGSSEILRIAPLAYFKYGGNIVSTRQTYKFLLDYAELLGLTIKKVDHIIDPLGYWRYDIEGLLNAVDSQTRIVHLVNPNNPTGAWLDYQQLKYMADSLPPSVLFLIDEAYIEFLPNAPKNGIDLIREGYKNVLVTRTFSKAYGLGGLRIGYGVSHPDVIKDLQKFSSDFISINSSGFYGAIAALEDTRFVSKSVTQAWKTLSFYKERLPELGLPYVIGLSPFVMVNVYTDADIIVEKMAERNVLVQRGKLWEMPTYIRISYGTDADNQRAIHALRYVVSE